MVWAMSQACNLLESRDNMHNVGCAVNKNSFDRICFPDLALWPCNVIQIIQN